MFCATINTTACTNNTTDNTNTPITYKPGHDHRAKCAWYNYKKCRKIRTWRGVWRPRPIRSGYNPNAFRDDYYDDDCEGYEDALAYARAETRDFENLYGFHVIIPE